MAPSAVHDDPPARPETKLDTESQPEADNGLHRDAAAIRRVDEASLERRKMGLQIGMNWFFHGAEAGAQSRLFFDGTKGEKTRTSFSACRFKLVVDRRLLPKLCLRFQGGG